MTKTLIIGLGNAILTDDGVGVRVAQAVQRTLGLPSPPGHSYPTSALCADLNGDGSEAKDQHGIEESYRVDAFGDVVVTEASVGGLRLMEMMVGYERVILVDALIGGVDPPGRMRRLSIDELRHLSPTQHSASAHDTTLITALEAGRRIGLALPEDVVIYAVTVENVVDFGDQPTPAVAAAIPHVVEAVLREIRAVIPDAADDIIPP